MDYIATITQLLLMVSMMMKDKVELCNISNSNRKVERNGGKHFAECVNDSVVHAALLKI